MAKKGLKLLDLFTEWMLIWVTYWQQVIVIRAKILWIDIKIFWYS
jgi:hypothetical protein